MNIKEVKHLYKESRHIIKTDKAVRGSVYAFSLISLTLLSQMMMEYGDLFVADINMQLDRQKITFTGTVEPMDSLPTYSSGVMPQGGKYATAYLGNYVHWSGNSRVPSKEGGGSHLGIDIVGEIGTPVYAVANGVARKVSHGTTGFGNHIMIFHPDFPDFYDSEKKTDYFSSYSHLSKTLVNEGDYVKKGDKIGLVGNSGISTAPHLHFQIDATSSPYKPWWPFTWNEASGKGYDFFSAVNNGLGKEKGASNTINPIKYVYKYKDYSGITDTAVPVELAANVVEKVEVPEEVKEVVSEPEPVAELNVSGFEIVLFEDSVKVGETVSGKLISVDSNGNATSKKMPSRVRMSSKGGAGKFGTTLVTRNKFKNGEFSFTFVPSDSGEMTIVVSGGSLDDSVSDVIIVEASEEAPEVLVIPDVKEAEVVDKLVDEKPAASEEVVDDSKDLKEFDFVLEEAYKVGEKSFARVHAVRGDGSKNRAFSPSSEVIVSDSKGILSFSSSIFTTDDFNSGSLTLEFKPLESGNTVLKLMYDNNDYVDVDVLIVEKEVEEVVELSPTGFTDVPGDHKYADAIKFLKDNSIVNGYEDGSFQPDRVLARVEALKIIMIANDIGVDESLSESEFSDVEEGAWFIPYIAKAKALGSVKGYDDGSFKPSKEVSKIEALKIMMSLMGVSPDETDTSPFPDVEAKTWFADYVWHAKNNDWIFADEGGDDYHPHFGLTRAGMAEIIYNMKK
jgi:hypothetical protein